MLGSQVSLDKTKWEFNYILVNLHKLILQKLEVLNFTVG